MHRDISVRQRRQVGSFILFFFFNYLFVYLFYWISKNKTPYFSGSNAENRSCSRSANREAEQHVISGASVHSTLSPRDLIAYDLIGEKKYIYNNYDPKFVGTSGIIADDWQNVNIWLV